jgi:D-sedoheptulose 7-phosphate isomerase
VTRVPRPAGHFTRPAIAEAARAAQSAEANPPAPADSGSMEALYPFLYAGSTDLDAVLDQARASSEAKAREVLELREQVGTRYAAALAACARDAAIRFAAGGRLLTFGNGGSATDAQQIASLFFYPGPELPALPAIGLASDTAVLTALSNDIGVEVVFSRQIGAFGRPQDIALGLSTSGNSPNLLRAFEEASRRGLMTIGIAGYDGGAMAELDCLDYLFVAPSTSIHRIQEAQTTMYHILWELVVAEIGEPVRQ